jgi:energy-coupling factor transporter ATP-binding protein EcfA2
MKIKKIKLKNYKFHHNLDFNINKNCLIYGENGSGKSSIYKALYSNFYYFKDKKIVSDRVDVSDKFLHRDFRSEDLKVDIDFDNEKSINRVNNTLENSELLHNQTIYLCDEKVLRKIVSMEFYSLVKDELVKHFFPLDNFLIYQPLEDKLRRLTEERVPREILEMRVELNRKFQESFEEYIPVDEVNKIIKDNLREEFEIEFIIEDAKILNKKLTPPKISLKVKGVDDKNDFSNHFNEAKLKLISIAIYFALAKKYETDSELKLLVLDDFLTSLDMSNRKLIMWYLLDNFGDYQKIILTHNLQFYNMLIKLLKIRDENSQWDIKNIFLHKEDRGEIAIIKEKEVDYLYRAKKEMINGEFHSSGNYLRKEFERIVHEFKQILEIGKTEKLQNIIDALKSNDVIFSAEPHELLNQINRYIPNLLGIINSSMSDENKILKVKELLGKINDLIDDKRCDLSEMKATLVKVEFYRNILFNPASHSDEEIEIYRKECLSSIKLLEELNVVLSNLK